MTLKKNREFSLVYNRGKSFAARNMALVYLPRKYGQTKAGFSVSKKVGCSVVRNKARRRMKECFRLLLPDLTKPCHLIFIARPPIAGAQYAEIQRDMRFLLRKMGLLEGGSRR